MRRSWIPVPDDGEWVRLVPVIGTATSRGPVWDAKATTVSCYLPLRVPPPFAFSIVGLPDLEPQERAPAPVRCRLVFADKALVSSLQNLPPRLQAVRSESPSREDQPMVIFDDAL